MKKKKNRNVSVYTIKQFNENYSNSKRISEMKSDLILLLWKKLNFPLKIHTHTHTHSVKEEFLPLEVMWNPRLNSAISQREAYNKNEQHVRLVSAQISTITIAQCCLFHRNEYAKVNGQNFHPKQFVRLLFSFALWYDQNFVWLCHWQRKLIECVKKKWWLELIII